MNNHVFYSYKIIGLNILCELPYEIEILKEAEDFLHPLNGDAGNLLVDSDNTYDLKVRLSKVNELPPAPDDAVFEQGRRGDIPDDARRADSPGRARKCGRGRLHADKP